MWQHFRVGVFEGLRLICDRETNGAGLQLNLSIIQILLKLV